MSFKELAAAGRAARLAKSNDTTITQKALLLVARVEDNTLKNLQDYQSVREALKAKRIEEKYRF